MICFAWWWLIIAPVACVVLWGGWYLLSTALGLRAWHL